jgi:hypothetical protein
VMLMLVAAFLSACGSAGGAGGEASVQEAGSTPAAAASPDCAALADELIVEVQSVVDQLSDATLDDLLEDDVVSAATQQRLDDLESRVEAAGCSEDEMDALLADRADRIRGEGVLAEEIRDALAQNEDLPF